MKTTILFAIFISFSALAQLDSQQLNDLFEEGKKSNSHKISGSSHAKTTQSTSLEQRDSSDYSYWSQANNDWQVYVQSKAVNYTYNANNDILGYTKKSLVGSTWIDNFKYSYTYDLNNNLTSTSNLSWNGTKWVNNFRYTYSYDANNNKIAYLFETGSDSIWEMSDKEVYTFTNNMNTYLLRQTWNGTAWVNVRNESYTYDANANMLTDISQNWVSGAWKNDEKITYTYDTNNKKVTSLSQQWNNTAWLNVEQTAYNYNGNQTTSLIQVWDTAGTWVNEQSIVANFNANNTLASEIYQIWTAATWENNVKKLYTWGGLNNTILTNSVLQQWNNTVWTTTAKYDQVYNPNGFLQMEIHKTWNASGTSVISGDSTYHYSSTVATGIENLSQTKNTLIYPNPAISELNISTLVDYKSIRIINSLGETIRIEGDRPEVISVSELTNGVYFVQLIDKKGKAVKTQKFIKN
ncbi:MAG: T9SS type A sorting domain-containing protein [Bacteroidota bacterium]